MRFSPRIALAVLTTAVLGVSPAFAQQPAKEKAEAELKAAKEKLEKLLTELAAQEKKAAEATKPAPPVPPKPPAPPAPPKPTIAWAVTTPGGDAIATLKTLAASKDPKTAALAKELLEQMLKSTPKTEMKELRLELVPSGGKPGVFEFKAAPPASGATTKPATGFEFKAVPVPGTPATGGVHEFKVAPTEGSKSESKTLERRIVVVGDKGDGKPVETRVVVVGEKGDGKTVEGRVVVIGEKGDGKPVETRVVVVGEKGDGKPVEGRIVVAGEKLGEKVAVWEAKTVGAGPSTLKLSADGKTAAVLASDGTITIYDVASGKEVMKFGGKK